MSTALSALPVSRWKRFLASVDDISKAVELDGAGYLHQHIVNLERRIAALEARPNHLAVDPSTTD